MAGHAHVGVVLVIVMAMSLVDAVSKMSARGLVITLGLPQLRVHPVPARSAGVRTWGTQRTR